MGRLYFFIYRTMNKITIKNKVYKVRYTFRALMLFEQITSKMFSIDNLTDQITFFFCLLLANNPDDKLTYEEFIDALDDDSTILNQFQKFLADEAEKRNIYKVDDDDTDEKKSN